MNMAILERLEEELNKKDEQIEQLERQVKKYEDKEENEGWNWTRHKTYTKEDNMDLPIPRLELRCHKLNDNWYSYYWEYGLVYRHLLGHIIFIPMGGTTCEGGGGKPCFDNKISLPFRDGVHIKKDKIQLNLPAFAILDDIIEKIE